jgi:hypothetical protein
VIPGGPVSRDFSGTGSMAIGSVSESRTVVLQWIATKAPMQIFDAHGFLLVNSTLPNGEVRLSRGVYKSLHVAAKGSWNIQIHAAG